jgi:hypothetical protein
MKAGTMLGASHKSQYLPIPYVGKLTLTGNVILTYTGLGLGESGINSP